MSFVDNIHGTLLIFYALRLATRNPCFSNHICPLDKNKSSSQLKGWAEESLMWLFTLLSSKSRVRNWSPECFFHLFFFASFFSPRLCYLFCECLEWKRSRKRARKKGFWRWRSKKSHKAFFCPALQLKNKVTSVLQVIQAVTVFLNMATRYSYWAQQKSLWN